MYISLYQPYTDTMMMNKDNHCKRLDPAWEWKWIMFVVVFNVYRIHEPCLLLKHSLSCFTFFLYIFESWVQMTKLQSFIRVTTLEFWVFSIRGGPDHPPFFSKWFKSLRESKGSLPPSFLCISNSDSHSKITNNSPTSTLNANKSHGPPPLPNLEKLWILACKRS